MLEEEGDCSSLPGLRVKSIFPSCGHRLVDLLGAYILEKPHP